MHGCADAGRWGDPREFVQLVKKGAVAEELSRKFLIFSDTAVTVSRGTERPAADRNRGPRQD